MSYKLINIICLSLLSTSILIGQYSEAIIPTDSSFFNIPSIDQQILMNKLNPSNAISTPQLRTTAFFCVMEEKLQKGSNVAVRFRIGSLNYVNTIEGKYYNQIDHITNTIKP